MTLKITWIDKGRKAKNPPNPAYPTGIDLDITKGAKDFCQTTLPYPAEGVGMFIIECDRCGHRTVVTAAGRTDDPRSLRVACLKAQI